MSAGLGPPYSAAAALTALTPKSVTSVGLVLSPVQGTGRWQGPKNAPNEAVLSYLSYRQLAAKDAWLSRRQPV